MSLKYSHKLFLLQKIIHEQLLLKRMADAAINIFSMTAVLSRCTRTLYGEGPTAEHEVSKWFSILIKGAITLFNFLSNMSHNAWKFGIPSCWVLVRKLELNSTLCNAVFKNNNYKKQPLLHCKSSATCVATAALRHKLQKKFNDATAPLELKAHTSSIPGF